MYKFRQDSLCYTSCGALGGMRNSSMGPPILVAYVPFWGYSRDKYHFTLVGIPCHSTSRPLLALKKQFVSHPTQNVERRWLSFLQLICLEYYETAILKADKQKYQFQDRYH